MWRTLPFFEEYKGLEMKRSLCVPCLVVAMVIAMVCQPVRAGAAESVPPQAKQEAVPWEKCGVIRKDESGKSTFLPLPSLHVAVASDSGPFTLPDDAPPGTTAIGCSRRSIVPLVYDYRVIKAGYPLYITVPAEGKTVALEMREGQIQMRALSGELTDAEAAQIQQSLDKIQSLINKSSR